jgi:hypothetical protein
VVEFEADDGPDPGHVWFLRCIDDTRTDALASRSNYIQSGSFVKQVSWRHVHRHTATDIDPRRATTPQPWRLLADIDLAALAGLCSARATAREVAWLQAAEARGGIPAARAGGRDLQDLVLDIDAALVTCHSDKEQAAVTYKRGFGYHPLLCFLDNTGEALAGLLRPGTAEPKKLRYLDSCTQPPASLTAPDEPGCASPKAGRGPTISSKPSPDSPHYLDPLPGRHSSR